MDPWLMGQTWTSSSPPSRRRRKIVFENRLRRPIRLRRPPAQHIGPKNVFEYRLRQLIRLRPRAEKVRKSSSNIVFAS